MTFATLSYGSAGLAYGLLTLLLLLSRGVAGRQGMWLLLATSAAAVWGLSIGGLMAGTGSAPAAAIHAADALRALFWTLCLLALVPRQPEWQRIKRLIGTAAALLAAVTVLSPLLLQRIADAYLGLLGISILGCLSIEQIVRNSTTEQRSMVRLFLWTVAVTFCYDLFVFADALLFGVVDTNLWLLRGIVATLAVPFLVLSAKRYPDWQKTLFISRHVVFYSATLTGTGIYLMTMAAVAVVIRQQGGEWGAFLQVAFFAAAIAALTVVLSSARVRTIARVFISKHFYRNRYEYRDEWLRLIGTLSGSEADLPLDQRGIKALAGIIESPGGQLWLSTGVSPPHYEPFAAWHAPFPSQEFTAQSTLVSFLRRREWVVDSDEYEQDPERYDHAFSDECDALPRASVIIPLMHERDLLGFVRLIRPAGLRRLNYEDHDLLKTAGRQVAAFLAHDLARERLSETRQFEAYSKLAAFVMHDLKNLLAQQSLLVKNAEKFKDRPEFVTDVIRTVDSGVQRMRRLLQQLEQRTQGEHDQRVELNSLVERAVEACGEGTPVTLKTHSAPLWVQAQPDRLSSIIIHLVVNAQQATAAGGTVDVDLAQRNNMALVGVRDTGTGMSEEFIRKRLFKPFETTKGASGMGIGVYQAREIVRGFGGELTVASELGAGTTVSLTLPLLAFGPEQSMRQRRPGLVGEAAGDT